MPTNADRLTQYVQNMLWRQTQWSFTN